MESKPLIWKDERGEKYKISYSEELQLKNLTTLKKQVKWQKINFLGIILLIIVLFTFVLLLTYTLYKLDGIDFFTRIAYR